MTDKDGQLRHQDLPGDGFPRPRCCQRQRDGDRQLCEQPDQRPAKRHAVEATITAVQSPTAMGGTASACATCVSGGPGVSYTPPADYSGGDTFTYTITDGAGHFDTATVSITIQASGTMDSTMILEDADLHDLDGSFDVLFGKSPRPYDTSLRPLKSTSPGHIHLRAEITQQHERQLRRRAHEPRIGDHHRAGHAGELRPRGRRLLQPDPADHPGPDLREAGLGAPGPQPSGQGEPGRQDRRHARGHPVQGLVDRRRLREPGRLQLHAACRTESSSASRSAASRSRGATRRRSRSSSTSGRRTPTGWRARSRT